jgi:membrane-bound acyltransferase YfiQ involved in biofilm formation
MSFALYLFGFAIITGGIAWALVVAGVPHVYIAIACLIVIGLGIVTGVSKTRTRDVSN